MKNIIERIESQKQNIPFYLNEMEEIYEGTQGDRFEMLIYAFTLGYIKGRKRKRASV